MKSAQQETVVVISENGEPIIIARMNGKMTYYKLVEMGYEAHVEFLGADTVAPKITKVPIIGEH